MPYVDEAGRLVGLLGVSRDVTERIESRRRLDAALTAGEVGTFEWDIRSDRLYGDANFARMFSIALAADGSAPLDTYVHAIHPEDREEVMRRVRMTVDTGTDYEVEYRIISGGGVRWVVARGKLIRDAQTGKPARFPGTILDITTRKQAEDAARVARERADFLQPPSRTPLSRSDLDMPMAGYAM